MRRNEALRLVAEYSDMVTRAEACLNLRPRVPEEIRLGVIAKRDSVAEEIVKALTYAGRDARLVLYP
jgi:hypothetical protein